MEIAEMMWDGGVNIEQVGGVAQHGEEDESEEEERPDAQHDGNFLRSLPPTVIWPML